MYLGDTHRFEGLAQGSVHVSAESLTAPKLLLAYTGLGDLAGILLDGEERRLVESSPFDGDGTMAGVVDFEMSRASAPKDVALTGSLGFDDVLVAAAYPAGGVYMLTIDGVGTYPIAWTLASDLDLTSNGLLPIEAP